MEFTEQPKQVKIHVPNFEQFKSDGGEKIRYKTETDKWTPSFDDPNTPKWAEWIAQDSDGVWWYYRNKPLEDIGGWVNSTTDSCVDNMTLYFVECTKTPEHPDGWQNTLTKRPESVSERVSLTDNINIPDQYTKAAIEEAEEINKIVSAKVLYTSGRPQQSTQSHYETKSGVDFIQRFIDVHSEERVRGGLLFNIGKYCERYGAKDDMLKEARKIADYANRLVEFEESLLEDSDEIHG